ncbi:MAG: hypothetical protein EBT03_06350 [Betaproteobacteria bacterium]|nr:hypothetical protein [Betaproteobacteria bacterium]
MELNNQRAFQKIINPDELEFMRHVRTGEVDGGKDYPAAGDSSVGDHEKQIAYEAKSEWLRHLSGIEQRKLTLRNTIGQLRAHLNSEGESHVDNLSEAQARELELLDQQHGHLSAEYRHLEEEFEAAKDEKQKLEHLLGRPLDVEHADYYIPILVGLAIAEVPVNRLAFELFFESMPLVSLLLSAAIGGIFIFFAHTIGALLKRLQCKEIALNRDSIYLSITLMAILALILMYFLGLMREQWVDVSEASQVDFAALLTSAERQHKSVVEQFLIGSKGFTLLLLNLAIFAMGLITSVKRHDPHPGYERAIDQVKKLEAKFLAAKKRHEAKRNEIIKAFSLRMADQGRLRKQWEADLKVAAQELDSLEQKIDADRKSLVLATARRFMAYQNANRKARKSDPPAYFLQDQTQIAETLL